MHLGGLYCNGSMEFGAQSARYLPSSYEPFPFAYLSIHRLLDREADFPQVAHFDQEGLLALYPNFYLNDP